MSEEARKPFMEFSPPGLRALCPAELDRGPLWHAAGARSGRDSSTRQRNRVNRIVDSCSRPSVRSFHVEFRNDLLIGTVLGCGIGSAEVRIQGEAGIRAECDPSLNGNIRWALGGAAGVRADR